MESWLEWGIKGGAFCFAEAMPTPHFRASPMEVLSFLSATLFTLFVFVLGACFGSFLNVVIYRIPAGLSLMYPPSRCPQCLRQLKKYDNVPVLGWLMLRGKCRFCKSPIPIRYPIVEALTGTLFVIVYLRFGWSLPTLGGWALLCWLVSLALIDLDTMTLPNALTRSGLVIGLFFQMVLGYMLGGFSGAIWQLMVGVFAAVLGLWLFDLITLGASMAFGQTAMGGGDAKLAAMIGAWTNWQLLLLTGFIACLLGAVVGGAGIAFGWINRRQPIPFGPFLAIGAALSAFWGNYLISTYMHLFFPSL
jgi:leader peptidase (prepilin peptidase) / N-methyltransferase